MFEDAQRETAETATASGTAQVDRGLWSRLQDLVELVFARRYRVFLLLAIVIGVTYFNSLQGEFVYDDLTQELNNKSFGHWDPETIRYIFSHDFWSTVTKKPETSVDSIYYRPVLNLALMATYEVAGYGAFRWHLVVLGLHILCVFILFLLLEESLALTGVGPPARRAMAFIACLVFAVHPVQTESVAWISDIGNPFVALLVFASFGFYLWFRRRKRYRYLVVSAFFFVLAVLSKESAIAIIPIIVGCELFVFTRLPGENPETPAPQSSRWKARLKVAVLSAIPFCLIEIGYLGLRLKALGTWVGKFASGNFPDDAALTKLDNLLTLPKLLLAYGRLLAAPFDLSPMYDFSYVRTATWHDFWLPLIIVLILAVILSAIMIFERVVRLAVFWCIPIIPHLRTQTFPSELIIQDHYLYLTMVGWGLMIAWLIYKVSKRAVDPARKWVLAGAVAAFFVAMCGLTIVQNTQWSDQIVFWDNAARHAPNSRLIHFELGRLAEEQGDYEGALNHYSSALSVNPNLVDALTNTGFVLAHEHRWTLAAQFFERVVQLTPESATAHFNLSVAYAGENRRSDAISQLNQAIQLEPSGQRQNEWKTGLKMLENSVQQNAEARPTSQKRKP